MQAAGKHVIIKPFTDEVEYKGLIALPDTAKAKSNEGIVMSVGQWVENVCIGDWVIFSRRQAHDIDFNGAEYTIVDERAIMLVIDEPIS